MGVPADYCRWALRAAWQLAAIPNAHTTHKKTSKITSRFFITHQFLNCHFIAMAK